MTGMKELIVNFHGIGPPTADVHTSELAYWLDKGTFENILDRLSEKTEADEMRFKVTFDDGNISDAVIALPALARRGMKATFFVCAGRIGKTGYLDELAIRDLLQGGMEIGSHGMHHVDWRRVSERQLQAEISGAKRILEQVSGRSVGEVAIPFGSFDRRVLKELRATGFTAAYSSDGGIADSRCWLRPRNTLDISVRVEDVVQYLVGRNSVAARIYRSVVTNYKALR
jgi:peptidoglycan/xylan/chitin deacetylase (PgdA/CDA1 family)